MVEDILDSAARQDSNTSDESEFASVDFDAAARIPALSVKEAAIVLGKSIRAINRSLSGKWGNRLPEGWSARKIVVDGIEEWQITPGADISKEQILDAIDRVKKVEDNRAFEEFLGNWQIEPPQRALTVTEPQATPVASELEHLLREVATAHKALAEERKSHIEDLRTLYELQSSMRLLEVNAHETALLKSELIDAQKDMAAIKAQYKEFMSLPWWKRLFRKPLS